MRKSTMIGLLTGGVVALAAGGVALAGRKDPASQPFCEYKVKAGDTLSGLGLRFFGDAKKWPALLEGQSKPFDMMETLPVGVTLRVPCRWHKVQRGETLAKIAQNDLGDGGRWKRIAELNREKLPNPDKLEVGMMLAIPAPLGELSMSLTPVTVGGLDLLGEDEVIFVGKGGGGHGGHGGGRGRWGGVGGPYWWGPAYADGIEVDELDAPTAGEIAAELAKHLKRD